MWVLMIIPVYSAAGFIDFWILNTVEFWTDSNPLTMNPGEQKIKYATSDGKTYKFLISKNKMDITETIGPESGKSISLFYSPENGNWIMDDGKDETVIAKMSNDNLTLIYPNKETKNIKPIY
jgi:hypothetical protein